MKNLFLAGAIAGLASGIASSFLVFAGSISGLYGSVAGVASPTRPAIAVIVLTIIFGATVFALIYSKCYDLIPGKGPKKGLNFGLIIWLVKDVAAGSYIAFAMEEISVAVSLVVVGFYVFAIYGLVLGYLYKKE